MRTRGIFIFFLILILISIFFVFHTKKRFQEIKAVETGLMAIKSDKQKDFNNSKGSYKRPISKEQIPVLIQNLYKLAVNNRLERYDILSKSDRQSALNFYRIKGKDSIAIYPLKISIEGDYRDIAEYVRELQNTIETKKIREIIITPEKGHVKADISLDIFISGEQDVSK